MKFMKKIIASLILVAMVFAIIPKSVEAVLVTSKTTTTTTTIRPGIFSRIKTKVNTMKQIVEANKKIKEVKENFNEAIKKVNTAEEIKKIEEETEKAIKKIKEKVDEIVKYEDDYKYTNIYDEPINKKVSYEEDGENVKIKVEVDNIEQLDENPTLKLKIGSYIVDTTYENIEENKIIFKLKLEDKYFGNDIEISEFMGKNIENNEDTKICSLKTIYATGIEQELKTGGRYFIRLKFDTEDGYIEVKQKPTFKVKINGIVRELSSTNANGKNYIEYSTTIEDTKFGGQKMILESISGGQITYKKSNVIGKIDLETKMPKELFTIDKFILVSAKSRGDINGDARLDKLDVQSILNCKDYAIADCNGDAKINTDDKTALEKAIENQDIMYINFFNVGNGNNVHGDVCKTSGTAGGDGIINYKDVEYYEKNIETNNLPFSSKADVNGDKKITEEDYEKIKKALRAGDATYLYWIDAKNTSKGDVNEDKIINIDDVFEIEKIYSQALNEAVDVNTLKRCDINGDEKIDVRDQAKLSTILVNNEREFINYIAVPQGNKGDINGDGVIDIADVDVLETAITKKEQGGTENIISLKVESADVTGDNKITIDDVNLLKNGLKHYGDTNNGRFMKVLSNGYAIKAEDNKGDIDGDGFITPKDANIIAFLLASKEDIKDTENGIKTNKKDLENLAYLPFVRDDITPKDIQCLADCLAGINKDENKKIIDEFNADFNGDGKINTRDLAYISREVAEAKDKYESGIEDRFTKYGDYNNDGKVNIRDAAAIAKKLVEEAEKVGENVPPKGPIENDIEEEIIYGDVDMSGDVGLGDLICITKYLINENIYPLIYDNEDGSKNNKRYIRADVNQDGIVDALDSNLIMEYNLGSIVEFTPKGDSDNEN